MSTRDRWRSSRTSTRPSGGSAAEPASARPRLSARAASPSPGAVAQVAARVSELAAGYEPPDFAEAPNADAALFLCAIDHKSGYAGHHSVDGESLRGSALLWALGCTAERRRSGRISARSLTSVSEGEMAELFRIDGETVAEPGRRAELWRDLAAGLIERYEGSAEALISACGGRLGGSRGLIARLATFEAFADPLAKKAFLFAKIAARRGWLAVADPASWEVCADNVLMRLALRSGLVAQGPVETVRADTRTQLKAVAEQAGLEPPLLDDLLWELGRDDPDLLGTRGGDLREPPRPAGTIWY